MEGVTIQLRKELYRWNIPVELVWRQRQRSVCETLPSVQGSSQ